MKMLNFTDKQVEKVFIMRCNGMTHEDIGKELDCSANYISHVLSRIHYSNVKVSKELLDKASTATVKRKTRASKKANGISAGKALAAYADTLIAGGKARKVCEEAGLSDAAIKAFVAAIAETI